MATPGAKRKLFEMDVSDIQEANVATVHGVFVGDVSRVRDSRKNSGVKLFEGRLTDGKKAVRVVSFEPRLRCDIEKMKESGEGVAVSNCSVQKSKMSPGDLEIVVGSRTKIMPSPKKFRVDEETASVLASSKPVAGLEEVKELSVNQRVSVCGKVVSLGEIEEVYCKSQSKTLSKADFVLGDSTAVCRGVLWEDHIQLLKVDHSYQLSNVTVRSFNGVKYVSLSEKSSVKEVSDIGDVIDEVVGDGSGGVNVVKGEIVGVVRCDTYASCRCCKAKVVEVSKVVGECSKCGVKVKMSKSAKSVAVQIIIEDVNGKEHRATAFNEVVNTIIDGVDGADMCEKLLSAPVMKFTITSRETVSSVMK